MGEQPKENGGMGKQTGVTTAPHSTMFSFVRNVPPSQYTPRPGDVIQRGRVRICRGAGNMNPKYVRFIFSGIWERVDLVEGDASWFYLAVTRDGWELIYRQQEAQNDE